MKDAMTIKLDVNQRGKRVHWTDTKVCRNNQEIKGGLTKKESQQKRAKQPTPFLPFSSVGQKETAEKSGQIRSNRKESYNPRLPCKSTPKNIPSTL